MPTRTDLPRLIAIFCLCLSFVRGTNIGLFYPPDEFQLGNIDYIVQTTQNYILLLGIALYFFLKNDYSFFREKFSNAVWVIVIGLAMLSLALSVNKIESLKFVVAVFVISTPSLIYLREFGAQALLKALSGFVVAMAFVNLAYILAFPEYGIMVGHHDGRWRGMFEHKNTSSPFFAAGFFIILHHLKFKLSFQTVLQILAMGICVLMLAMAQSSTALVTFAGLAIFYPLVQFLFRVREGDRMALLLILISVVVAGALTLGPMLLQLFFEVTGKDATLTGRTGIWSVVLDLVGQRPLYGFGPGLSERPEFMERIQGSVGWDAKSTHNSFLDLLISFGYPLSILISFLVIKAWFGSFMDKVKDKQSLRLHVMATSLILVSVMVGMASASAFVSRSIIWIMMVIGLAILVELKNRKETV